MKALFFLFILVPISHAGPVKSTPAGNLASIMDTLQSMGYVVEQGDRILTRYESCGLVSFDFSDWLSRSEYAKESFRLINKEFHVHQFHDIYRVPNAGYGSDALAVLTRAAHDVKQRLTVPDWVKLGDATLYYDLAKRILGEGWAETIVGRHGLNTLALTTIKVEGRTQTAVIVDFCVATTEVDKDYALPSLYIRPRGTIEGFVYEYPRMPLIYAYDDEIEYGVSSLLVVREEDILFNGDGIMIIDKFGYQGRKCSLTNPEGCIMERTKIEWPILLPLNKNTLVVTFETQAWGMDYQGKYAEIRIKYPIFVHTAGMHTIYVGGKTVGDETVNPIPSETSGIFFLDTLIDPITWQRKQKEDAEQAQVRAIIASAVVVSLLIILIIILIIVVCCYKQKMARGTTALVKHALAPQ